MSQGSTRFRTSWTFREGNVPAVVLQARVVNVNLVNWTVDVVSQFDQLRFFDIQVGSPYLHPNAGEGQSIFPERGAKCMVCIPSDSSPPYVQCFVMPVEVTDLASPEAPAGTTSHASPGATTSGASFAGGRKRGLPGSFNWETRDGNFLTLYRGGVLALGANALAQRIYLPLASHVVDISKNYSHHNSGGSIQWLIGEGPDDKLPSEYGHTFRVYADSEFADVRVKCGKVSGAMQEPSGSAGNQTEIDALGLGAGEDFIVYEVTVAKNGFNPVTGDLAAPAVRNESVFRFFFDRAGGTFLRCKGSMVLATKKKFTMQALEDIDIESKATMRLKANGLTIDGGSFVEVKGDSVRIARGTKPAAHVGSMVQGSLPYVPMPSPGPPVPFPFTATIITGDPRVLVGSG